MTIEGKVRKLLEKDVEASGVFIDSVKLEKEDNNLFLRIVIDRDEIIDIDKCVEVTNIINPLLDEADLIKEEYILDISSKERG
mgnify:CR=1 FL=1